MPSKKILIICPKCKKETKHFAKGYCFNCYRKYAWKKKKVKCKNCGRIRYHKAFGLCGGCHVRLYHYDKTKEYNARKYHNIGLIKLKELTKQCIICGFNKIVELHHLDGDKQNTNDKNLIGLCPNCHKLIHSYQYFEEVKKILQNKGYNTEKIYPANYVKK